MVSTIKFSQMPTGGDLTAGDLTAGLLSGTNVTFTNPWTFLAPGSTASRPVPSPAIDGRLRFNTDSLTYEYYDTAVAMWIGLSGSGTGTVNPGTANSIAFYAANGTAVSPTNTADLAVLVTNGAGFPSLSTTLPTGLSIPSATITASTAALTSGQVIATPINPTDLVNKAYVDAQVGGDVTSITGTTNQIIASSPTGAVTLSLPQDIALGSTPTFGGLTLTSIPLGFSSGGTNASLTASNGGIFYSTASAAAILSGTATANQVLLSGSSTAPAWSTATYPPTTTINQILYSSAANTITGISTLNNGVLITGATGVPSLLANSGTVGFVLTANSGAPPSWQAVGASGAISTIDGDAGTASPSAGVVTISGGTTGLTTSGSGSTLSLTGVLKLINGGTNAALTASNGGIFYSTSTAGAILAGTATASQVLLSGASTTPSWSTATYPASTTINQILYSSSSNVIAGLATLNNGVLITGATGVPALLANSATPGFVLTANAGAPPSWQASGAGAGITSINGDAGSATPSAGVVTISGGTTGLTTSGASSTLTLTGVLKLINGGTNAALTASNGGIFYSTASAGAILAGTATASQVLLSGSSTAPAWSTATYPATTTINQILYSSAANTITGLGTLANGVLVTNNSSVPSLLANSGTAGFVLTANSAAPPSWQAVPAAAVPYVVVTGTSQAMAVNTGYASNNAGLVTLTLPTTAAVGNVQYINGLGAGGWKIAQNASQLIHVGNAVTTTGVGGSLASSNQFDAIALVCLVANTTWATIGPPQSAGLTIV